MIIIIIIITIIITTIIIIITFSNNNHNKLVSAQYIAWLSLSMLLIFKNEGVVRKILSDEREAGQQVNNTIGLFGALPWRVHSGVFDVRMPPWHSCVRTRENIMGTQNLLVTQEWANILWKTLRSSSIIDLQGFTMWTVLKIR